MPRRKNNLARKKRALNYFMRRILDSKKKDDIIKMYLFGSMLKGNRVREDSDVDVLVFGKRKRDRRLEDIACEIAFDTIMKYGESVEPLIYSLKDFKQPKSAFLKRVIQDGRELYSTL